MKFRSDDELLTAAVVRPESYLFTVTAGGTAKRTELSLENYRQTGRGGLGIRVANLPEDNGQLVGALVVDEDDEVLVIMEKGKIVRSAVNEVRATGRNTQGVHFAKPGTGDRIIAVAKNVETRETAPVLEPVEPGYEPDVVTRQGPPVQTVAVMPLAETVYPEETDTTASATTASATTAENGPEIVVTEITGAWRRADEAGAASASDSTDSSDNVD